MEVAPTKKGRIALAQMTQLIPTARGRCTAQSGRASLADVGIPAIPGFEIR
jgi:hypothetical protein